MSLTRMGKSAETVRFLDDVDLTLSLDSRSSASHRVTNMQLTSKAIVFRASYRDINLITTIVNKAIALYSASTETHGSTSDGKVTQFVKDGRASGRPTRTLGPSSQPVGNAKVVLSKEQVNGIDFLFQLFLI